MNKKGGSVITMRSTKMITPPTADTDRRIGAHWLVRWRLQERHEFRKRGRVLEQEQVPTFVPA
jgi:hypothetical protein